MNKIIKSVKETIAVETADIKENRIPFADEHHAYAIAREELEEAEFELEGVKRSMNIAWGCCMCDDATGFGVEWKSAKQCAILAASELIQFAAVCDKYLDK